MRPLLMFLILLGSYSCKTKQTAVENDPVATDETTELEFDYRRDMCFGHCPEYSMSLSKDGTLHLEGKKNIEYIGAYESKLKLEDKEAIAQIIMDIDLFSMESEYRSGITDKPSSFIHVKLNGREISIDNKNRGAPAKLMSLENKIHRLIDNYTWTKVESTEQY